MMYDTGITADTAQPGAKHHEPRPAQHQLIPALAFGEGVDFINHHSFQPGKNARRILIRHQEGKAFGGGQKDMRRVGALAASGVR
jgi:hypothetical protein